LGEILRGKNGKIRRNGKTGRETLGWAGKRDGTGMPNRETGRDGKQEVDFTSLMLHPRKNLNFLLWFPRIKKIMGSEGVIMGLIMGDEVSEPCSACHNKKL
jgi:hypothetical protein